MSRSISATVPGPPPTATAQQKGVRIQNVRGKSVPIFFKKKALVAVENALKAQLPRPDAPLEGPVCLRVRFEFPWRKSEPKRNRTRPFLWKDTVPDTDNMLKLVKDVLGDLGWWKDDAQVADERTQKVWGPEPKITIRAEELNQPDSFDDLELFSEGRSVG